MKKYETYTDFINTSGQMRAKDPFLCYGANHRSLFENLQYLKLELYVSGLTGFVCITRICKRR